MKFKYFLLFVASILLVDSAPSIAIPRQLTAPSRPDGYDSAPDTYQSCQTARQAVVTIYAGTEIGSGSIINPNGLIITNHHVVKEIVQSAGKKKIYVKLANGNRYIGQLLKTDLLNDLALIQIAASEQLPTIQFASTNSAQSGQRVCAIGSPFGRAGVLSEGTLNRVRSNGDLQSNVLLNPGNSGGPLLNARGEMIGVNKAILESPSGKNTGISFATGVLATRAFIEQAYPGSLSSPIARNPLPAASVAAQSSINAPLPETNAPLRPKLPTPTVTDPNLVIEPAYLATLPAVPNQAAVSQAPVVETNPNLAIEPSYSAPDSVNRPQVTRPAAPAKAQLGVIVNIRDLIVQQVQSGSPAAAAGIQPGDRLIAINGDQLRRFEDLQALLNNGLDSATVTLLRSQKLATVRVNF